MRNFRENEAKTRAKGKVELPKSEWIAFLFQEERGGESLNYDGE